MGRKIWAFVAFNVYSLFLISAFQENTAYLFDASLIEEMSIGGFDIDPREWGWGDHYIWRLFSGVVVTAIVGFLAGTIAKKDGSKTAAFANIPSVLVWAGTIYLLGFTDTQVEARTGFVVVSVISIPLTTYVAYLTGGFGEEVQQDYPEDTVIGIRLYHLIWLLFPLYWYSLGIVVVVAKFIGLQLATWSDMSIFAALMSLLTLVPIIAWVYPLRLVHRVLMGELLNRRNAALRGIANVGILISGMIIASAIQFGSYWLLSKIVS